MGMNSKPYTISLCFTKITKDGNLFILVFLLSCFVRVQQKYKPRGEREKKDRCFLLLCAPRASHIPFVVGVQRVDTEGIQTFAVLE